MWYNLPSKLINGKEKLNEAIVELSRSLQVRYAFGCAELTCVRRLTRIIWTLKSSRKCGAITQGMCYLIWRIRIRCRSRYNAWNNSNKDFRGTRNGFLYICPMLVNLSHRNSPLSHLLPLLHLYDLRHSLNIFVPLQQAWVYDSRIAFEICPLCVILRQTKYFTQISSQYRDAVISFFGERLWLWMLFWAFQKQALFRRRQIFICLNNTNVLSVHLSAGILESRVLMAHHKPLQPAHTDFYVDSFRKICQRNC